MNLLPINDNPLSTKCRGRIFTQFIESEPSGKLKHQYSRFKYGSIKYAKRFAKNLVTTFVESQQFKDIIKTGKKIVVSGSSFYFVPVAATTLTKYFVRYFNIELALRNYCPAEIIRIYRNYTYEADYSAMSAEERTFAIAADTYHLDFAYLQNKELLLIDDVRIAGGHERRMEDILKGQDGFNYTYLYQFILNIEDHAVENRMNKFAIHGLKSISKIINEHGFAMNTRVLKYILTSSLDEFDTFIEHNPLWLLRDIIVNATGNNYANKKEYQKNFQYLLSFYEAAIAHEMEEESYIN